MKNKPIRHHYIPQFILRNFCVDDGEYLFYYNQKTSETSKRKPAEIFMVRNLYRDGINNTDDPTKIETDLARFESEVAKIITDRFLNKDEITITLEEDEKLKLFFAIMAFRSKNTRDQFGSEATDEYKTYYSMYQKDGDLNVFWKRNLGNIVNCRSIKEVLEHEKIDDPIKIFFLRDMIGPVGLYFVVAERRGPVDFIISDAYPTIIFGTTDEGMELSLYSIFPISSDRVILLVSYGAKVAPRNVAILSDKILKSPTVDSAQKIIRLHVKKMYEDEVRFINTVLKENAHEGFAFKSKDRIDTK